MGSESEEKKEMLIIDGNAVYEIDEACLLRKREEKRGGQSGCRGIGCPLKASPGAVRESGERG